MAVYASFAVVLLFLVWLHLSWLILLLGAQLSYYVQHPEQMRAGRAELQLPGALRERIALALMTLLAERFVVGGSRWRIDELSERLDVPGTALAGIVDCLEARGLVLTADDETVAPARDLAAIPLAEVLEAVREGIKDSRLPRPRAVPTADIAAREAAEGLNAGLAARTVRDLIGDATALTR
jgi:membrane protein